MRGGGAVRSALDMCRVSRLISGSFLASAATLALASCAAAATHRSVDQARCLTRGARTLAVDSAARVFSLSGSVYGCIDATGARRKLGGAVFCNLPTGRVGPVQLSGEIVAYGLETCGVDTASSTVVVRDLTSGRRLEDVPASTLPLGPESFVSVESLVLRKGGAVGWIAEGSSITSHVTTYEVHRFEHGKSSLLESGSGIHPMSLRLVRSRMSWRDASSTHSASLG